MEARSPLDRLTKKERALVVAKLKAPKATIKELVKIAGFKGKLASETRVVRRLLLSPQVKTALRMPPPTLDTKLDFISLSPQEQKGWLLKWYVKLVENRGTPQSERIRALNAISDMIPGAKVPVGVHHTGAWSLEQFVAAAGGKPADAPGRTPEDMPN